MVGTVNVAEWLIILLLGTRACKQRAEHALFDNHLAQDLEPIGSPEQCGRQFAGLTGFRRCQVAVHAPRKQVVRVLVRNISESGFHA
jgi:hypothetical protein